MSQQEMRKFINMVESTPSIEQRKARVEDAIRWLEDNASRAAYPDPWTSRAGVIRQYARRDLEMAEKFILNGDNFLDAGWPDPFGLVR